MSAIVPDAKLILGIDGGGTKMTGCLLRSEGEVLALRQAPPANFGKLRGGIAPAVAELAAALLRDAGVSHHRIALAGVCHTGVGRESDRQVLREALSQVQLADTIVVESDAMGALTGAFGGGPGIIVSAGTGAVAYARTPAGEFVRVGGWGYLLGDEGSGFALVRAALNAALQDWDGRGPRTRLRQIMEQHFGVPSIELCITQVYDPAFDRGQMAALAPLVFAAATSGDAVAQQVVHNTGYELGRLAHAAVTRFAPDVMVDLVLLGRIFTQAESLLPGFWQAVGPEQQRLRLVPPRFEAVLGAALFALLQTGTPLTSDFLQRFADSRTGLLLRES